MGWYAAECRFTRIGVLLPESGFVIEPAHERRWFTILLSSDTL